jgi:SAM-dependent methyltransferase
MKASGDAFGRALYDAWRGRGRGHHIVEREDGLLDALESAAYFRPPSAWEPFERQALRYARGRVLDIGCGAGRHALVLQERGLDVLATDISPLAVRVSRARGVRRARVVAMARIPMSWGPFDTILMLGNNFGMMENRVRAKARLRRLYRMTTDHGRILAGSRDPYAGAPAEHRRYHRWNRGRGRMGGQVRLRVRYRASATPWSDYLILSRRELQEIVRGTGWRVAKFFPPRGALFIAVLEKSS